MGFKMAGGASPFPMGNGSRTSNSEIAKYVHSVKHLGRNTASSEKDMSGPGHERYAAPMETMWTHPC